MYTRDTKAMMIANIIWNTKNIIIIPLFKLVIASPFSCDPKGKYSPFYFRISRYDMKEKKKNPADNAQSKKSEVNLKRIL